MTVALAWRILTYDKGRTALALVGIFMAILLVFIQLGLFFAVPQGGMLLYDNMRFDLLLVSNQYEYQAQPGVFPLSRLAAVRGSPDVAEATPLYFGVAKWKGGEGGVWPDLFVIGFDPASDVLTPDSIDSTARRARASRHDPRRQHDAADVRPARHRPGRRDRRPRPDDRRPVCARHRLYGARGRPRQRQQFRPIVSTARAERGQSRRDPAEAWGRPGACRRAICGS